MKLDLKKSVDIVFQLADIIDEYNVGIKRIYKDTGTRQTENNNQTTKEIVKLELLQFVSRIIGIEQN